MLDVSLQPKQHQLLDHLEATGADVPTWLGYGGALGGGKSAAIRRIMLVRRGLYPATNGVIIRRVYDDLKKNHIDQFWLEYPELQQYYKSSDHEINLPNLSKIQFMYAETFAEVQRKFTGNEFFDIFVDQAEQFSEQELRTIKTRNRWPGRTIGECKMSLYFNPGGVGTEFLRRVFWLKQYKSGERPTDFSFIQAYGWDNYQWFRGLGLSEREFYLLSNEERFELFIERTQYGRELNALPKGLRAGHLLGSFDHFAGQYFAGVWDESATVLSADETEQLIQPWWTRWTSTDWGFAHHACHLWYATGKVGPLEFKRLFGIAIPIPVEVVVVYREVVVNETAEVDLAHMLVERSGSEKMQRNFLSPDAFAKKGNANTVAQQLEDVYEANGLPRPESADNDRIGGWRLMYKGFHQTSSLRAGGEITREMCEAGPLLFVSGYCPEVIAAIPMLIRDEDELEDVMKAETIADDVADSFRYGYKTMLSPRREPRDLRARKVWETQEGSTTQKAIAMAKWTLDERKRGTGLTFTRPRGRA